MRGVFTAGVLQAFMDEGFVADELVGVSAGASNGASYVSNQSGRGYRTNVDYAGDKRYASLQSWRRTGSFFGMDFIFGELPERLDPFDYEAFEASPCDYYAGATHVQTGHIAWFGKPYMKPPMLNLRASCSIPMLSPIVEIDGEPYLDGGIAAPIPIDKAITDGCEKLIVILTRERGFKKKPQEFRALYHWTFRKNPAFVKTMDMRHLVYNHTLERLWRMEAEGRAIVVAPPAPLEVDRFGKDAQKMIEAFEVGKTCGLEALHKLG